MVTNKKSAVRVRLAPSPTGLFHFGTARTAIFNWLFAKQNQGVFVLRIEDTDRERSEKRYEEEIFEALHWLGIDWDEGPVSGGEKGDYGPYRQTERTAIYKKYLSRLLEEKKAYYCYCTKEDLEAERQAMLAQGLPSKYGGHCRNLEKAPPGKSPQVIRFKTPETHIEFKDLIRGNVKFDADLLGDMVLAKNLETPLYNFAVVIDDEEMRISHVIRGEDHLSNTPKQILIQRALGFKEPYYAHLPLILGSNRAKLSKRHMETSLLEYRARGYLPEAIVNFLALLGWHPSDNQEIFTIDELMSHFDLGRVQKGGAIFNEEKMEWINSQHLSRLSEDELADRLLDLFKDKPMGTKWLTDRAFLKKVVTLERDRMKKIGDFFEVAGFFFELPEYEPSLLTWKKEHSGKAYSILSEALDIIKNMSDVDFTRAGLQDAVASLVDREGRGEVLWPLRVAVSGRAASPDPLDIILILGREEAVRRITVALQKLAS